MRNVGGVIIPDLEDGAPFSLRDQIMINAPKDAIKIMRRRERMRKKIEEEWHDRKRLGK